MMNPETHRGNLKSIIVLNVQLILKIVSLNIVAY